MIVLFDGCLFHGIHCIVVCSIPNLLLSKISFQLSFQFSSRTLRSNVLPNGVSAQQDWGVSRISSMSNLEECGISTWNHWNSAKGG